MLGPNGAGKTTTILMACCVVPPTRGTARIAGHDIRTDTFAAKRAIGLVPQDLALYEDLSPRQNLQFFGSLYGLRDVRRSRRASSGRSTSRSSPIAPTTSSRNSRAA